VLLLDTALANLPSNSRQSVAANAANSAAPLRPMVKLHQDYNTMIDPTGQSVSHLVSGDPDMAWDPGEVCLSAGCF
jgi:hypothetical protein